MLKYGFIFYRLMGSTLTTTDIDTQIAKLEEKLNNLLDKIQEAQSISVDSPNVISEKVTQSSQGKSRKEILAEYEKEYLARLEVQQRAEIEIQKARDEVESKKNSIREALPKGF